GSAYAGVSAGSRSRAFAARIYVTRRTNPAARGGPQHHAVAAGPHRRPHLPVRGKTVPIIERLPAADILDSRGRPTVSATCRLRGGTEASASVPSGASTGTAEALELRDGDPKRYRGLGCRKAVAHVNGDVHSAVAGRDFDSQEALDRTLLDLDGTPNKSRLGANALLAVSVAFARACALER